MINIIPNCWRFFVLMTWLSLSIPCSFAQTANVNVASAQSEVATPNTNGAQFTKEVCKLPEPCQQFTKLVTEPVIQKSTDDSKAISNLTNSIYFLTLLMMVFTVFTPILMFFLQNRQEKNRDMLEKIKTERLDEQAKNLKELVNTKTNLMKEKNDQLQQDMSGMKKRIHVELRNEFKDVLSDQLERVIDNHMKYYNTLVQSEIDQQSGKHEGRLYHAERVHLDLMDIRKPRKPTLNGLSEWLMEQQEDYVTLLQLISPDEEETFSALGFFQEREVLPVSFLSLLRFLDKQDRLPGKSRITAMKMAKDKFGESLDPQTM